MIDFRAPRRPTGVSLCNGSTVAGQRPAPHTIRGTERVSTTAGRMSEASMVSESQESAPLAALSAEQQAAVDETLRRGRLAMVKGDLEGAADSFELAVQMT